MNTPDWIILKYFGQKLVIVDGSLVAEAEELFRPVVATEAQGL